MSTAESSMTMTLFSIGLVSISHKICLLTTILVRAHMLSGLLLTVLRTKEQSFIASKVFNQPAIWSVMFNDSSKHRPVVCGTCGHLLKLLEDTLCGDKKKGPIKPSHRQQILPDQESLLITANSWRSFQRGLYQGQEHLDLNYPWHNVWPFCYHRGRQHLLTGHEPRGHQGY